MHLPLICHVITITPNIHIFYTPAFSVSNHHSEAILYETDPAETRKTRKPLVRPRLATKHVHKHDQPKATTLKGFVRDQRMKIHHSVCIYDHTRLKSNIEMGILDIHFFHSRFELIELSSSTVGSTRTLFFGGESSTNRGIVMLW